jgi:hypothetical protein
MVVGAATSTGRPWPGWQRLPVDAIAFLVIAVVTVAIREPFLHHGMTFCDASWFFHFGRRALDGDVPYRDYVFQVGPLPIYVDALFQKLFGGTYMASMYASLFIHVLRVFVLWALVRRLAGCKAATLLACFGMLDAFFGWSHHWSWAYAQLFIALAGLSYVAATRATSERRVLMYLGLCGLSVGANVFARQATAITSGGILLVATAALLARGIYLTRRRFVALWLGFGAALAILAGALACAGALGPAIRQVFLDAPEKKGVHGVTAVLDAVSGGAVTIVGAPWWWGLVHFLVLPALFIAGVLVVASRGDRTTSTRTIAMFAVPVCLVLALASRHAELAYVGDMPRCWLIAILVFVVATPRRLRAWFGIEPMTAVVLGGLSLGSDAALEMSYPGRGWGDWISLLLGAALVVLASARLTTRRKTAVCAGFALAGLAHFAVCWYLDLHPFAKPDGADGTLGQTAFATRSPLLEGTLVSEPRARMVDWLTQHVRPGDTCFVYGIIPVLYDVLGCKNPTDIDVTIPDFITVRDAERALAILRAHPPDFVIAQERSFMNPPLSVELEGRVAFYSVMNSRASEAMHSGLRRLVTEQYEDLGLVADVLGPELTRQVVFLWDCPPYTRLYRRRH